MFFRAIVTLSMLMSAPAAAQCEITGVASIDRLRVGVPPSEHMRMFTATDLPIAVRPGTGGSYRDVRVLAPIAFDARSDAPVPWAVPEAAAFADGMLWLTPLVEVEEVLEHADGGVVLRAQVDESVWLSRVRMPCGALVLGYGEGGPHVRRPTWGVARGPRWQPRSDRLWLMARAGEGASARLDAPGGLPSPLVEIERSGAWVRVAAEFASGAALRGWTRASDLRSAPRTASDPRAFVRSLSMPPSGSCARPPSRAGEYFGPAQIAPGTRVHTRPDGAAWATISEPALVTIALRAGSTWARIVYVPGLRGEGQCPDVMQRAWVPRASVTIGERSVLE